MAGQDLARYLPAELLETYVPVTLLREGNESQTILLEKRENGEKAVLKRSLNEDDFSEEKYRLLTELDAEDVARVYGTFCSGGASYLLQEYIPGESLLDYMQKRGPLSAKETAEIGISICRALQKLHGLNPPLIHRDIKAENIIRTPEGSYVLIDFGISRLYESSKNRDSRILGTSFSAPPEQFGYQQTDPRSDIYAVGVLLHELATGEYLLGKGELPPALRPVVRRCTRFDPADRYPSAAALEKALRRAIAGNQGGRQKRRLIVGGLLAALALCAALLASAGLGKKEPLPSDFYHFASSAIEAEVCRQLEKEPGSVTYGDLEAIDRIFLCADVPFEQWDQLQIHGAEINLNGDAIEKHGAVDSLDDISHFPNLRELALCNQELKDLSPLSGSGIEYLALHGNRIEDLSPLTDCQQLQELYVSDNPAIDLTPLAACPVLRRLNIGATPATDLAGLADFPALVYLEAHDCIGDIDWTDLAQLQNLRYLSVRPVGEVEMDAIGQLTGLVHLYIWGPGEISDLTPLAGLANLNRLYIDMPLLGSLRGAEAFAELEILDVRGNAALDVSPLLGLTRLRELNTASLRSEDWAVLSGFPELAYVRCSPEQEADIRLALADRPEVRIDVQ